MTKQYQLTPEQQQQATNAAEVALVYAWMTAHLDEYQASKHNGRVLAEFLQSRDMPITHDNLTAALWILRQEGKLSDIPDPEPQPEPAKVEIKPKTLWGFDLSKQALRKMSVEDLKRHCNHRLYGQQFREAITKL